MGCRCRYDAPDIYGDHAFSCARGRGERGKWHDGLRDVWRMIGSMAGASISKEVSGFSPSSNNMIKDSNFLKPLQEVQERS
jgi:hypothetical protein